MMGKKYFFNSSKKVELGIIDCFLDIKRRAFQVDGQKNIFPFGQDEGILFVGIGIEEKIFLMKKSIDKMTDGE